MGAATLTPESFEAICAAVRPRPEEQRWLEIPWETDLATGVAKARARNLPIFLWAMNGNPLGCV